MKLSCETVARAILGEPPKRRGAELLYHCPCPAHQNGDQHPSLGINQEKDTWFCGPSGSGGNAWELAAFLAGLAPANKHGITAWLRQHGLLNDNGNGRKIVAHYEYQDEHGELLYEVVRYSPKDFRQRRPDGKGGWIWNLDGVTPVPYRLPEWKDRETISLVEGERDADALWEWHVPATTNPMGAGKWRA